MMALIIVASCLIWVAAIVALWWRPVVSPVLSFLALLCLSLAKTGAQTVGGPFPLVPVNSNVMMSWLCMTVVVTGATVMQPAARLAGKQGMAYLLAGAVAGLAVGLLAVSFSSELSVLYGCMVIAVAAGTFFGWILFANTPAGKNDRVESSRFFQNLLAKGFPVAITVMQIGVPLVILVARTALK